MSSNPRRGVDQHHSYEKGTKVKPIERSAKPASTPKTGFFAMLRASLPSEGVDGSSRSPRGRRLLPVVLAVLAAAGVFAVVVSLAFASNPPVIDQSLTHEEVFATRAYLEVEMRESTGAKWQAEYITVQSLEEAEEKKEPAKWTISASGTAQQDQSNEDIHLGTDPPLPGMLHHLAPSTTYDARFQAEGPGKEVAVPRTFTFKTTAITKPEIAKESLSGDPVFRVRATSPTSAVAQAQIESNGAKTSYVFEYAPAESNGQAPAEGSAAWLPIEPPGTLTVAQDFATPEAKVAGLTPETKYFARVKATNIEGTLTQRDTPAGGDGSFTTPTNKPVVIEPTVRNVTSTSAHLKGAVAPTGLETEWRFEYTTEPQNEASWKDVAGAGGKISQAQAEGLGEVEVQGSLTGLDPSTVYYVRLFASSAAGEGHNYYEEPIAMERRGFASLRTFGPPSVSTFAVHGLHGEALRVMGGVNPDSVPTSGEQTITVAGATGGTFELSFEGKTTGPIAFNAPAGGPVTASGGGVWSALEAIAGQVEVTGPAGGPYTIYFSGKYGEVSQPALGADSSDLTGPGSPTVKIVRDVVGGEGYDTHYHFEYVAQKQFEAGGGEGGFARAGSTSGVDLGTGDNVKYVGADLPVLTAGETYRFRAVASNTSPHEPVIYGEEQSLMVPATQVAVSEGSCPNEVLRTGPSALLPDCRAFEQLTPVDKEGAKEIFNYGGSFGNEGALPGESGDSFVYASPVVKWGSGPSAGQSPYFFSRTSGGWRVTAGTAQPEAGIFGSRPQVFGPGLAEVGFAAFWVTSPSSASSHTEFEAGPAGGPYVTVASVPSAQAEPGWVASSGDFSKLVLQVADHTLLGHSTHTGEGDDLYEYSNGALRQANVTGPGSGVTIGSCGATIADPSGSVQPTAFDNRADGAHAVSVDGSRVFFEAVPTGEGCSEAKHLYVRVNGGEDDAETIDLGAYTFLAANPEGSRVLLVKPTGENPGLYLYKAGSPPEFLPSSEAATQTGQNVGTNLTVSEDLSTVYIRTEAEGLYRYDVAAKKLLFVTRLEIGGNGRSFHQSSPDGRYYYFVAETVAGLPGGGEELEQPHAAIHGHTSQVYRYDSAEAVVQCMSCASSFDPEPRLSALFTEGGVTTASADGDYVFFDTPAALVPSDVDGEVAPEGSKLRGGEHGSSAYSLSSDVYEWRRDGVDGCAQVQGCLALITSGHGGFLNELLGTTSTGGDVFFATKESLLTSDDDTAEDIYDARIGGGFAEPPRPVECKGDSCSTPFVPPSEVTPSSASFQGAGNLVPEVTSTSTAKEAAKKHKKRKKSKKKLVGRRKSAKKSNRRGK